MKIGDLVKCNGLVAKDPKESDSKTFIFGGLHQVLKKYRNKHGAPRISLICLSTGTIDDGIRPSAVTVLS
tara:strand:- start:14994 stop:15203 length:210 start_codon:yes stop_codon:yes gene_type:complete